MAKSRGCPFAAGTKPCFPDCQAYDPAEAITPAGVPCLAVQGFKGMAKLGSMFDPKLAGSLAGLASILAPNVITRRGLFARKPKPGPEGDRP